VRNIFLVETEYQNASTDFAVRALFLHDPPPNYTIPHFTRAWSYAEVGATDLWALRRPLPLWLSGKAGMRGVWSGPCLGRWSGERKYPAGKSQKTVKTAGRKREKLKKSSKWERIWPLAKDLFRKGNHAIPGTEGFSRKYKEKKSQEGNNNKRQTNHSDTLSFYPFFFLWLGYMQDRAARDRGPGDSLYMGGREFSSGPRGGQDAGRATRG